MRIPISFFFFNNKNNIFAKISLNFDECSINNKVHSILSWHEINFGLILLRMKTNHNKFDFCLCPRQTNPNS